MSSRNLKKKMMSLTTIEDWDNYMVGSASQLDILFNRLFDNGNIFQNIYVAIRNNPQNSTQEENPTYTYYNVGHSTDEITRYFVTKYGLNYFAYRPDNGDEFAELKMKLLGIYNANEYKYRKLIETLGYKYNPIWNVDGIELYSNAEALGDSTSVNTPKGTITTSNNPTTTHYVNPYDQNGSSSSMSVESKDEVSSNSTKQKFLDPDSQAEGKDAYSNTTDISHKSAKNYTYNETTGEWEEDELFSIKQSDVAFGITFNGPERLYAEKRIRQGNIGVTMTQQLLEAERNLVNFNILDVFFKDIEKDLIVGLY